MTTGPAGSRMPILAVLSANLISLTGNSLTTVAVPWFVLVTSGSAAKAGITGAAGILPSVISGILGGTLVDRIGFKRTSIFSDLLSGLAILLIPILYHTAGLPFSVLLGLLFVSRLFSVPGSAARQSLVPDLASVATMPLERANAAYSATSNVSTLAGSVLAGLLIAVFGASNVLIVDALTFVVSAVLIGITVSTPRTELGRKGHGDPYFRGLGEGFGYLLRDPLIFAMSLVAAAFNFLGVPLLTVILPFYARHVFGNAVDLGVILGAIGAGTLVGAIGYGIFSARIPRRLAFLGALFLVGTVGVSLTLLPGVFLTAGILTVMGLATGPLNPITQTVIQERVPTALLGRVLGFIGALGNVASPLGLLFFGILLEIAGLQITIFLDTVSFLFIAVGLVTIPSLKHVLTSPEGKAES